VGAVGSSAMGEVNRRNKTRPAGGNRISSLNARELSVLLLFLNHCIGGLAGVVVRSMVKDF
jgi:hypothetical protein